MTSLTLCHILMVCFLSAYMHRNIRKNEKRFYDDLVTMFTLYVMHTILRKQNTTAKLVIIFPRMSPNH